MPVDKDRRRPLPLPTPETAATGPKGAPSGEGPRKVGRKQVSFSAKDAVATFVKGEGMEGHAVPRRRAAKDPAPSAPLQPSDKSCRTITRPDGSLRVLWPSGQRYDGALDGTGAPHGLGTVTLSHGPVLANARWSHGVCVAVGAEQAPAGAVEAYRSPTSRRKKTQALRSPPRPESSTDAAAQEGTGKKLSRGGAILNKLRKLTKPRDKGQP